MSIEPVKMFAAYQKNKDLQLASKLGESLLNLYTL